MATHTNSGGNYGRKFAISREDGANNKNGRPYFFEWIQRLPDDTAKRKLETRRAADGSEKHYELFSALDGYLVGVNIEQKNFSGKPENWLVLSMIDGPEEYRIEVGQIDSRYSMDIMKRLLDPNFIPSDKLRLSPFAIEENGKWNIGLSAISGMDTKLKAGKQSPHLYGMPQAESVVFKGETKWDFSPVAVWLYEQIKTNVCGKLRVDPISQHGPASTSPVKPAQASGDPFPAYADAPPETDDLPF